MKTQFSPFLQKLLQGLFFFISFFGSSVSAHSQVKPVSQIDLRKLLGTWYVIAYIPGKALPKDCFSAKATYFQNPNKDKKEQFLATFICRRWETDQFVIETQSNEIRLPPELPAKNWWTGDLIDGRLQMNPGWYIPFWVDHWILELHSVLVIGGPKRTVLVIYSKTPNMSSEIYHQILQKLEQQGYDHLEEKLIHVQPWYE